MLRKSGFPPLARQKEREATVATRLCDLDLQHKPLQMWGTTVVLFEPLKGIVTKLNRSRDIGLFPDTAKKLIRPP